MELGISTASFFSKELTEDTFEVIRGLGIGTCEVFLTTFSEYESQFVELLAQKIRDIKVYSLHTLNVQFEPELFNLAPRTRSDAEVFFKKIATGARLLDAKYYTFHGLARLQRTPYTVDFARIGHRLDELDEMLAEIGAGCRLAYENVHWTIFNSPDFFRQLKKYSNVHTCLDIKQAMQSNYCVYDYIDAMGDRLKNVHVCDFDTDGNLAVPGKGSFDFIKLFQKLYDIGYNGPVIMELYARNYQNYEEIKQGYQYLQECKQKIYK